MSGTFSSFNTALSALRYNRVAMDAASQNISNVGTEGYTRRRVESATAGTPTQPAMWSRNQSSGGGVMITGITRMTDIFLDSRLRTESGKQALLDTRQAVLDRLETGIGEPGDNGVAAAMAEFKATWGDLANAPHSDAARSQVTATGAALADAINLQARNFDIEASDQRMKLDVLVGEVETIAADLAATNEAIAVANLDGADAGNLMDQRDLLSLRLAELTGGSGVVNDAGGMDFSVGGALLVQGKFVGSFDLATGGSTGAGAVSFAVGNPTSPAGSSNVLGENLGGEIGGVAKVLDVDIPGYRTALSGAATALADAVNAIHADAYRPDGNQGGDFFEFGDTNDPAGTIKVRLTDTSQVATALVSGTVDGSQADKISELTGPEAAYQQVVNAFGTEVASSRRLATSQSMLTQQVAGARDQQAGVNLDEEMLKMVEYQRSYEAAARLMTTLDSMLDTLINRTGLLR